VESLLQRLTGAEEALVVNNCAAAALLILSVLASNGETIVSRGELVEIGGDFRVPDVMASSGTRMVEVGTTNKTHLEDYRRAINDSTRLIMRVHPSNYRVIGFASSPSLAELATLAHEARLPLYEDAGSGLMSDLTGDGLIDEQSVSSLMQDGADVVSFSGDKLLGSAQAGLIVGNQSIIQRLRRHPLYRALRSDKLRLAALEATLIAHEVGSAKQEIPSLRMLTMTQSEIENRAQLLRAKVIQENTTLNLELQSGDSAVGGGAAPTSKLPTTLIALTHKQQSAQDIEKRLRAFSPPIICRIANDQVLLDLRTVFSDEEPLLIQALKTL
jgi:L-seryl-tRNA(Ser) seleniumtransferase